MAFIRLRSVEVTGRPIDSWPGDLATDRESSRFKAGWSSTIDLLDRELHHLSAKNVVLQLAMRETDFRLDGAPKANARATHPGVILSLDSAYGPLSYPCDRFTSWQDNLRAIALALEALRKVDRYGVTKRGEQYTGWKQLGSGIAPEAPMTRQQAAEFIGKHGTYDPDAVLIHWPYDGIYYRTCAQKLHPDKPSGSTDLFQRLQEAKRVLDGAR